MSDLDPGSMSLRGSLQFLGRVQFTIVLLTAGAVAMAIGTVIESRQGAQAAQALIYRTLWFDLFLGMIAVNLVVAVVNRLPIRRHQWAFVVTHISIVVLLAGAWVSRTFGFEGELHIAEGGEEGRLLLPGDEVRARWSEEAGSSMQRATEEAMLPLPAGSVRSGSLLQSETSVRPAIRVLQRLAHGTPMFELGEAGGRGGSPGVELHAGGRLDSRTWLLAGDARFERRLLGSIEIDILHPSTPASLEQCLEARAAREAVLRIQPTGARGPVVIRLPEQVGQRVPCGDRVFVTCERFLRCAKVGSDGLEDVPDSRPNPAAVLHVERDGQTRTRTVFARYPDFDLDHGAVRQRLLASARLEAWSGRPSCRIIVAPDRTRVFAQITTARGRERAGELAPGQCVSVADTGIRLTLDRLLPAARARLHVRERPEGGASFIRLAAAWAGEEATVWLRKGGSASVDLGDRKLHLGFRRRSVRLPFRVALTEFEVAYHPGSSRPSSFASQVAVRTRSGPPLEATVAMNRPLDIAGLRIFQAGYRLGRRGRPDTSIFTVSYDPGVPIVYSAFVLIILGVGWYLLGSGRRARRHVQAVRGPVPHVEPATAITSRAGAAAASRTGAAVAHAGRLRPEGTHA